MFVFCGDGVESQAGFQSAIIHMVSTKVLKQPFVLCGIVIFEARIINWLSTAIQCISSRLTDPTGEFS